MHFIKNRELDDSATYSADWVLITRVSAFKDELESELGCDQNYSGDLAPLWTDKYSNVLSILGAQPVVDVTGAQLITCYTL